MQAKEVVNSLGKHAAVIEEAALQQKAMDRAQQILNTIDVGAYVSEGKPLQDCLRKGEESTQDVPQEQQKTPPEAPS